MTFRPFLLGTCALVAFGFPAASGAQTADPATTAAGQPTADGDIVVTARQRNEKLQDVPVSVTAFTSKQLEDAGVKRVEDFIHLTPNITFVNSQSPGTSFITIRGLTQNRNQPAPVAIVVDGVLQASDREFAAGLLDIASIEVVRGPQGALYGRNATGGAIIINTKQPGNTTEGHVEFGAANGGEFSGEGTLSGPIVQDKLFARISSRIVTREGYFDNVVLDKKVDPLKDYTVQGLLKYTPTPDLTIDLHANYSKTRAGALNLTYQPANLNANYTLSAANPFDFSRGDANSVTRFFYANNIGDSDRTITSASARIAYDMGDATLTSVSAYVKVSELFTSDQFPYTASRNAFPGFAVDGAQSQYVTSRALSQELRLTSRSDQPFRWMAGAYAVGTNRFISTTTSADNGFGIIGLKRTPMFNNPRNPTLSFIADDNHNFAWALFGNVEYDLTDRLEAAFALRYDRDNRKQFVSPFSTTGQPGAVNRTSYDKLQPKVTLNYKLNDDLRLFASYGVGFRSGQFNQNGVGAAAATVGLNGVSDVAKQEETESYEAGFKSQFLDHRLTLNGTFFRTDAKNVQYFVFVGSISAQVLVNIDQVRITGGEMEASLRLIGGLSANLGVGITDSKIVKYALAPADVGNKAPFVPNKTITAGLQYVARVGGGLTLTPRVDYELRGKQFWSPENETSRKDLNLVNLRLALAKADSRWDIAAWVKNVGDLKYNEEYGSGGFAYAANPRTYGASLRYNF